LGRRQIARDIEVIERDLEQRVVGDLAARKRIDHRLEVLEGFGVSLSLEERKAALVLPPRQVLVALLGNRR